MGSLPLWLLCGIFVVSAAVIWCAGIVLSETTDVLDAAFISVAPSEDSSCSQ
jgi:cation:H+ antiporter